MTKAIPPAAELSELIRLFFPDATTLGGFERCEDRFIPRDYCQLLAHEAHMTVTVEQRHGCSVAVEVLQDQLSVDHYVREILLRRTSDNRVVQYGIVRLKLAAIDPAAREEILGKQTPLGRVLIQHNIMRHVQLLAVWKFHCGPRLANCFGVSQGHETYGRTALIHCNDEPAIELLEIVAPEDTFAEATETAEQTSE